MGIASIYIDMIKIIMLSVLLNADTTYVVMPTDTIKVEARKRGGKGQRGRKRGGSGLR